MRSSNILKEEPATMAELAIQLNQVANGDAPIRTLASAPISTQPAPTPETLEAIVAQDNTLKSDQYFPIILTFPGQAGTPAQTPTKTPLTAEEKRSRTIVIATILLLIIIALVVFSVSRKSKNPA